MARQPVPQNQFGDSDMMCDVHSRRVSVGGSSV